MQAGVVGTLSLLAALFPVALVVGALWVSSWRQGARRAEIDRQIAATDAIHAALGAVVSPVVRRSLRGRWSLAIPVPLDRPDTVMQIVEAASSVFSPSERGETRELRDRAEPAGEAGGAASPRPGPGGRDERRVGVMDLNIYLVEWWAKERLGELQAAMLRERIAEAVRAAADRSRRARTGTDQPRAAPAGKRRGRRSAGGRMSGAS